MDDPDNVGELVFEADPGGELQGVYFSATDDPESSEAPREPDVIRLLDEDRERRLTEDTGLLSSIGRDDLQNTDVLVFRAATGELVLERRGLRAEEIRPGELGVDDDDRTGYRLMLRGPWDSSANVGAINRRSSFQEWATDYQLTEPFQSRDAFHLQPGEFVEVVAINRTTGYMGTQRVQLKSIGDSNANGLSVRVDDIQMRPPNLKVWAERDFNIDKGLQAGEKREDTLIGAEGAGLSDDERIVVYTEWRDHDGSPLPEGLSAADGAQYGLTGRLAKVVAPDTVQATSQSELAEFPIMPGLKSQVLKFPDKLAQAEHYYVQVIGKAKNQEGCSGGDARCATFDDIGANVGADAPLDTRPQYITPFLVPHYDEQSHWLAYREYKRLLRTDAVDDAELAYKLPKPDAPYAWTYRPEYQFSRLGLEVDAINKTPDDVDGTIEDILDADSPTISSADELLDVLYSLIGPEFDRLTPIDGGQDFVLALGEDEIRVTMGEDNTLQFDNLAHLAKLDSSELLSMRLYLNQDAANILWEFAFSRVSIYLDANNDGRMNMASVDPASLDLDNLTDEQKQQLAESDHVSGARPFRFWLNNDYDVVTQDFGDPLDGTDNPGDPRNDNEQIEYEAVGVRLDRKVCPEATTKANKQSQHCTEDQVVEMNGNLMVTNSDADHRNAIESFRDLEDFAPMVVRLDEAIYDKIQTGEYGLYFEAKNIGINLFRGTWEEELPEARPARCKTMPEKESRAGVFDVNIRKHLENCQAAYQQTEDGLHLFYLSGIEYVSPSQVAELFKKDPRRNGYKANLLFEGVDASSDDCTKENASACYFEVAVRNSAEAKIVAKTKTYIDLQPIKSFYDHFTAGTWIECTDTQRDATKQSSDDGEWCEHDPYVRTSDLYQTAKDVHAGNAAPAGRFHQSTASLEGGRYRQNWQNNYRFRPVFTPILEKPDQEIPYVMFVHGWPMPYAERVAFAETSYKRLYWQGYKGRFGLFSWPTGWIEKGANQNTVTTLIEVFADINNDSRSERIARDAGPVLTDKLAALKGQYQSVHLFAHSMGNVVVSEALLAASGTVLDTYVATQAATVAGAYAPKLGDALEMFVKPIGGTRDMDDPAQQAGNGTDDATDQSTWGTLTGWFSSLGDALDETCLFRTGFEIAWRCNNIDHDGALFQLNRWYDPPPDWYRNDYAEPRRHPKYTAKAGYYAGIRTKVKDDRIINFFNEVDAALDGWNLGQITKPDYGQRVLDVDDPALKAGDRWDHDPITQESSACDNDDEECRVTDYFASPLSGDTDNNVDQYDLDWNDPAQRKVIASYIMPSRTYALGATAELFGKGEIESEVDLQEGFGFTNSDYHHSAQWLESYTERRDYWARLNSSFFGEPANE